MVTGTQCCQNAASGRGMKSLWLIYNSYLRRFSGEVNRTLGLSEK